MPRLTLDEIPDCYRRPNLDNVNEVELDLLLTTAIAGSKEFASYLFGRAFKRAASTELMGVWRGSWGRWNESARETQRDVSVLAQHEGRCLLLIENKFVKKFQPEQSLKYREFGDFGLTKGWWDAYRTCLCGPTEWVSNYDRLDEWDDWLTFSNIRDWFEERHEAEPIARFMSSMMQQADHKSSEGGCSSTGRQSERLSG